MNKQTNQRIYTVAELVELMDLEPAEVQAYARLAGVSKQGHAYRFTEQEVKRMRRLLGK
jgi:hypothetical protein